jgi:hypothetical protein
MDKSFAKNIDLAHGIVIREPKAHQTIQQKNSFEKSPFSIL